MTNTDEKMLSDAKATYDRACGAVTGSNYTGFLFAMTFGFWTGDHFGNSVIPTFVIEFVSAFLIMAVVRIYFTRHRRLAEDNYHRLARMGKYAATVPSD